ncbi:MAG: hypothetical protein BWY54_00416 [Candidatus Dependentiae bacterium ADurb.Bin331]|nr:MAG: hypothetical protein BWY54_00416 [Candidatus Dependentiae bacterium ADurb.Bin331]
MKIINLTFIALTFSFAHFHQSTLAMENPKNAEKKKNYKPKNSQQRKELSVQKKAIVRVQKIDDVKWQKTQSYALNTGIFLPTEKQKLRLIGQKKALTEYDVPQVIQQPMEKEITISNPQIEIVNRSQLLQNDLEKVTIKVPEPSQIQKNGSLADSTPELEDFPRPTLSGNANNNNEPTIITEIISPMVNNNPNRRSSSVDFNEKPTIAHELQNQLPSNEQIVKTATSLNETLKQQKIQQSTLVQKQLTQEELFEATRNKIDQFTQVVDDTYVQIFDKFITSTQKLPETKTSGFMEFYLNRYVYNNPKQDPFEIEKLTSQYETDVLSLFADIKSDLNKISDRNKRSELIGYFKANKNKWCMNAYYTEKILNALMHDNKHKTSQDLDNINIKNGENNKQVTPELYRKITSLTDECTNNMQIFGNTIYDKSNLAFEKKYRIEKAKAEKYELPQLIKTANNISSTISTWMITQLY